MSILVTGGAGYIGSRVVAHLLEQGREVVVLDSLLYGGDGIIAVRDHPSFRLVLGDVRSPEVQQEALGGVTSVVHMAALVGEPACAVDPAATWAINTDATASLARAAREAGVERFVFLSTCSNYGVSSPNVLATEDTPVSPLSLYAESKVAAEQQVLDTQAGGMGVCVLRLGTICGLSARMRFNLLVNDMARAAALGLPLSIYAPEAWRPFLHIRDAARVIRHCLGLPVGAIDGRVFNVVSENFQKRGLVELARRHFPDVAIETTDAQPDLRDYRVSAERIAQELGFHPTKTVEAAFLETATAVRDGLLAEPFRDVYEALPPRQRLAQPAPAQ